MGRSGLDGARVCATSHSSAAIGLGLDAERLLHLAGGLDGKVHRHDLVANLDAQVGGRAPGSDGLGVEQLGKGGGEPGHDEEEGGGQHEAHVVEHKGPDPGEVQHEAGDGDGLVDGRDAGDVVAVGGPVSTKDDEAEEVDDEGRAGGLQNEAGAVELVLRADEIKGDDEDQTSKTGEEVEDAADDATALLFRLLLFLLLSDGGSDGGRNHARGDGVGGNESRHLDQFDAVK